MLQFIFLDSFWSSEVHWNTFIKRGRSASSVVWRPYRPDWHLSMRTSSSTPLLSYLSVVLLCADSSFMPHRRKPLYPSSFPVRTSSIPFTSSWFSLHLSPPPFQPSMQTPTKANQQTHTTSRTPKSCSGLYASYLLGEWRLTTCPSCALTLYNDWTHTIVAF